jgi:hypothetical protein
MVQAAKADLKKAYGRTPHASRCRKTLHSRRASPDLIQDLILAKIFSRPLSPCRPLTSQ